MLSEDTEFWVVMITEDMTIIGKDNKWNTKCEDNIVAITFNHHVLEHRVVDRK